MTECREADLSNSFFAAGQKFLGVKYPLLCGAMTWVSDPKLVAAVVNAGAFASLAAGNMPPDVLQQQIRETRALTDGPFGVNLITISPSYRSHLEAMKASRPPVIVFAGSFPRKQEIAAAKETGARVMCFASTLSIAERMVRYGADALILEGMEAGGHVGHVSLTVLLQQVLFETENVPVFVAGGVGTGRMCAHLLLMGAAGVQLGTRFVMAEECIAHENFKNAFSRANARDAVSTPQFDSRLPVVAVRALRNDAQQEFGQLQLKLIGQLGEGTIRRDQAQEQVENFWMGALRKAVMDGDVKTGSLMAGQSVGLVNKIMPVKEIVHDLLGGIEAELQRVKRRLNGAES